RDDVCHGLLALHRAVYYRHSRTTLIRVGRSMNRSVRARRILVALALASLLAAPSYIVFASGETGQATTSKQAPQKKNPLLKLAEAWPSAEVLKARHAAA